MRVKFHQPKKSFRCLDTGVHIVPLQAMTGQLMVSTGICQRCGQTIKAQVGDTQVGKIAVTLTASPPEPAVPSPQCAAGEARCGSG